MNYKGKKGVDISSNNGNINFEKIKDAGYDFVMIRCGYGSDIKSQDDSRFEENVKKAEKAGMPWGAYLYSYACDTNEAKSEVQHVVRLLKNKKPTFPIAFDMEDADGYKQKRGALSKTNITAICKTFLENIKKAGFYPMLYTSLSWIDYYISSDIYSAYDVWIAQWNSTCDYKGTNLGIWQYGGETNFLESNSIAGVGVIDKDKSYKDYPTIIKGGGYNGWPKSTKKVLDTSGYKQGDNTIGLLAMKELLLIAKKQKIITQNVDENGIYGEGTKRAVNQVLKLGGYKQNSIAGKNFIKYLAKLIKNKIK